MFPRDGTREEIIRNDCPPEVVKERSGFNSSCLCMDCIAQFEVESADRIIEQLI
jgi:hypothetical protein